MSQELNDAKVQAEIDKLKEETAAIRRPFAKPLNWIPLVFGAAGLISAVGQWQVSKSQKEQAALVSALQLEQAALTAKTTLFEAKTELADVEKKVKTAKAKEVELKKRESALTAHIEEMNVSWGEFIREARPAAEALADKFHRLLMHTTPNPDNAAETMGTVRRRQLRDYLDGIGVTDSITLWQYSAPAAELQKALEKLGW